ncbi:MAG TPA: VIT1/CCC1 transporter family protein [Candidatus Dormibacteraeota bacterium]|jgi:VIT1/CCC1 family predicted Fe2+/Mn2+ transporter/rubrerythrin|nr:VIT1/CCC1 transporter family protein [Candidatus Dormibacteraeota bacterium]
MADTGTRDTEAIKHRLLENWREEVQAAAIYRRLADREPDEKRKKVLAELAETEDRHAQKWAKRLDEMGTRVPERSSVRLPRSLDLSLRFAPVDAVIARQEAEERRLTGAHSEMTGDGDTDVLLAEISAEDAEHAAALRGLLQGVSPTKQPQRNVQTALDRILSRETWHRQGGGSWVSGAVYGANDGLAAVFGIVAFTSSATNGSHVVLLAGLGGAIASAVSMGSGAFLATRSENELYQAQIHREREEIEDDPEEERKELELFYQLKGLSEAEAKLLADRVAQNPKALLDAMAQEELGLPVNPTGNPVQAGLAALISTAVGAIIPVIPFFFLTGEAAIVSAGVVSIVAHFAVGAAKALFTLRKWWASGLEMTVAGIVVGAVTYVVGFFFHLS